MRRFLTAAALLALALPGTAGEVASANLDIVGVALEVDSQVITGADIPAQVQTRLGGKTGDDVPANSLTVAADLTGPGLDAPLTLFAKPGQKLALPPLHEQGDYALLNVRLLDDKGHFLLPAVPASVSVKVVGVLSTSVSVKQLTPDELRARGISVDSRNYDVYDYSFTFAIGEQTIVIPYPVIIDKRTHEVVAAPGPGDYQLPKPVIGATPPRFQPPTVYSLVMEFEDLSGGEVIPPAGGDAPDQQRRKPVIPAALVIPTGFGVLHQFFAVILNVSNSAPDASQIVLDAITATIGTPAGLRVVKVNPAVTIGQPVPLRDAKSGAAFLIAQAQGAADWSLEALRTGTHTFDIDIRATYKQPGQLDVPLKGHVSSSLVVSDPRFQVNFVHPDNVRQYETYTAYAFITNTSASSQTVKITNDSIPACNAANTLFSLNVCRVEGTPPAEFTIDAGQTAAVPYKLKSGKTGHIYAASAAAPDGVEASVTLTMGVSESGIPLSPATLIMPWYAQYVHPALVEAQMPLLGLGYSVATAPMTPKMALLPRVIRNDVFQRARDIARAGERIFVTRRAAAADDPAEDREAIAHLSLDLLGNVERTDLLTATAALAEWDQLRLREQNGRVAGAAIARELERTGLAGGKTLSQFTSEFAAATSHRSPYFFALVHGGMLTVTGANSKKLMGGAAELPGWTRTLPFGELTQFSSATESGQLALVGRWVESLEVAVAPASPNVTVDLIYPDTADGAFLTTSFTVTGATPVTFTVNRGNRTLIVNGAAVTPLVNPVSQTPLAVAGAAQDLHLDPSGHIVSVLFNRPVKVADAAKLRDLVSLTTAVASAGYSQTKKNTPLDPSAPVVIPGAAVSDDGKLLNISFDHALSNNATYVIGLDPISDLNPAGTSFSSSSIVPRIDNDAPGGIVLGKVLRGDNTPVGKTLVQLTSQTMQYDTTLADGTFIFEFVPRDINRGLNGNYNLSASAEGKFAQLDGSVRTPGEVQRVVLQFLGRGSATGKVTYSDGSVVANAPVTAGSTVYAEFHRGTTNDKGEYSIGDLPVGPLTFAVQDSKGNVTFAANQIRQPGEAVVQDLVIQKRGLAGLATIRVLVKRSDTNAVVAGAHVGVWSQGYGLVDGYTDISGRFEFRDIPAGFISILAAEFGISLESANVDLDVTPDSVIDQTLILHVPDAQAQLATLEGDVKKDDPAAPGDPNKVTAVPGAIVNIGKLAPAVADATGHYSYPGVPVELAGKNIVHVFDPATGRGGIFALPAPLNASAVNQLPMTLQSSVAQGTATLRVRLTAATGEAVNTYRVIWPGYPPGEFNWKGGGRYEMAVKVPAAVDVWAVPVGRDEKFGDQVAHGSMRADFDGQVSVLDLRLPGQGSLRASILVKKPCAPGVTTCPDSYDVAQGLVDVSYRAWSEQEQGLVNREREPVATENVTGLATITQVPAGENAAVATIDHPAGYAAATVTLRYEGDSQPVELKLAQLGDVTGRVYNYDGQTPVAGAAISFAGSFVRLDDFTRFDGSFRFPGVAGAQTFRITAKITVNGIDRVGYVDGGTPLKGGPVGGLSIVLREQASIEGVIVDASGSPVPLAHYWAVGLAWPNQTFDSSAANPLIADQNGRFVLNNVFAGAVRVSASSPVHQEDRGDWQGEIKGEGDDQKAVRIVIGSAGSGSLTVTVVDSDTLYQRVANAEVTLLRNGAGFDFASTDANGTVFFTSLPATGTYALRATSKKVGRSGSGDEFSITAGTTTLKQVVLNLLGRVSGAVRDGDLASEPVVKGAPVYLFATSLNTAASTDGAGAFLFNGVPEGNFSLDAIDLDTGRHAKSPTLTITKTIQEIPNVQLKFDKTGTLRVKVYLPDDQGNSSGVLAPLALVKVTQAGYSREAQAAGEEVTFTKMFANAPFTIDATELGGEGRVVRATGTFAAGSFDASASVWFPTSGTVEVRVAADDPSFIPGARVVIVAGNKGATVFTDATGIVTVANLPLGPVSVQVTSGLLTAAGSGTLLRHSETLIVPVKLAGNRATLDGFVDAEGGGASVGTRVVLDVTSPTFTGVLHLETRTDSAGKYLFQGVPVSSTHVSLLMLGPDNFTVGARASKDVADGTTAIHIDKVRLDATPPTVTAFDPANNANSVAPNAQVFVTFNETLEIATVTAQNFRLIASDDNSVVAASVSPEIVNGRYRVRIAPTALLRSNLVYRVEVSKSVKDLAGNTMTADVASSFTTVNYTEPRIIRVDPPVERPLDLGTTFRLKFNKPIDLASFSAPNDGVAKIEQLDAFNGAVVRTIPIAPPYLDPTDASALFLAPTGVAIEASSFYRVTVARVRDTQQPPNIQTDAQSYNYFSFDRIRPVVTIVSPVPAGAPLVSGVSYTPAVAIVDEGTNPPAESKDIKYVEWLLSDGVNPDQVAAQAFTKPWGYNFPAPIVTSGTSRLTLKARAYDLSDNQSDLVNFTWDVVPNAPPADVAVLVTPASVYLGGRVTADVTFKDEGVKATVSVDIAGKHLDGSDYHLLATAVTPSLNQQVTRATAGDPWPKATFGFNVPADMLEGAPVHVIATVEDSPDKQKSAPVTSDVQILTDSNAPQITSIAPANDTQYTYPGTFTITVKVKDAETAIARVALNYDGNDADATGTYDAANQTWTFTKTATITAKVADTRVRILATAYDLHGNTAQAATEVVYKSVNDGSIPVAQWITPLDGAALPAGQQVTLKLRVHAIDDVAVQSVAFTSSAFTVAPVTAPAAGDLFDRSVTFTVPTAPFTIAATVKDADPTHDQTLPIAIDVVQAEQPITADGAITASTAASFAGKSLVVSGASTRFYINVPITLQNLIVLGGAQIGNPDRVKIDLTVKDHLFIEAGASIDLTGKGYAGGWRTSEDGATTNSNQYGLTAGGAPGATGGASASHGGLGADGTAAATNAAYGSIADPSEFGAGGSGGDTSSLPGARGGGALVLRGGTAGADHGSLVVAGAIRADGESGVSRAGAGAGGSVVVRAKTLVTGPATRISANGGDDDGAANAARGGGGGRVAVAATDRFEIFDAQSQFTARGGRNQAGEGRAQLDGGAGTVFLRKPGAAIGELAVSAFDERNASSTHLTRPTPLSLANGLLTFDALTAGPRALARFDDDYSVDAANIKRDATAVILKKTDLPAITIATTPTPGGSVIQSTSIGLAIDATSDAGVGRVAFTFDAGAPPPVPYFDYPPGLTASPASVLVAPDAALGTATLRATVTDRAGRTATTAPSTFTVVANVAPTIDRFDVTPASLQTYAGGTIAVDAAATDDVAVTALDLTATNGTVTKNAPVVNGKTTARTFSVATAKTLAGGTSVALTLKADDNYATHTATQQKTVAVLHDPNPPVVTITSPDADHVYEVSSLVTIPIRATVTDAEVGVVSVWATVDGGPQIAMTPDASTPNGWKADIPVPATDSIDPVAKQIVVSATDYEPNTGNSAPRRIYVKAAFDPAAPVVAWLCPTSGAMFPAGYAARLRVSAVPGKPENDVSSVTFYVGASATPYAATKLSGTTTWEALNVPMPAGSDGDSVVVRAVANAVGNKSTEAKATVTIVTGDTIAQDKTIITGDAQYDAHTVIVTGGTLTIDGPHTFARLVVLDNATVQHTAVNASGAGALNVTATGGVYVSCLGTINVNFKGYQDSVNGFGRTWNNTTTGGSLASSGGSHGGAGGTDGNPVATAYGSIVDPNEPGGAGGHSSGAHTYSGNEGGGIARISAASVTVDGSVVSNGRWSGQGNAGAGAGGSIRIEAGTISGSGTIHADGGNGNSFVNGGGGGRIALYYGTLTLSRANVVALGGPGTPFAGAGGTVYFKQNGAAGFGDLQSVSNSTSTIGSSLTTSAAPLPDLGSGTVTAVSGTTVTLSGAVPEFIGGSQIDFLDTAGAIIATYSISARSAAGTGVVLTAAPSNISVGTVYRGVWAFDQVTVNGNATLQAAVLRTPLVTTDAKGLLRAAELRGSSVVVHGRVEGTLIDAGSLKLENGALLTHAANTTSVMNRLVVKVAGSFSIDATSSINVTGKGYQDVVGGVGRTWPFTFIGGSSGAAAGSHGGHGGGGGGAGVVYGSLFDPNEPGAAGAHTNDFVGNEGGGVVRINAGTLTVNGSIVAGSLYAGQGGSGSGAGGSIRIDAGLLEGAGSIRANPFNAEPFNFTGGGGRIAIYASSMTMPRANVKALSFGNQPGAAGTLFFKIGGAPFGDLLVENSVVGPFTELPSLGRGVAQSGTTGATLVTDRAKDIPSYFIGHLIEITGSGGTVKGTWRIATINAKTVTLTPNASESISLDPGDQWAGLYRFDNVTATSATVVLSDKLSVTNPIVGTVNANQAAPQFPAALRPQIVVSNTPSGVFVAGPQGAVTDSDAPILLTATNKRTGTPYTATAAADGSFTFVVDGASGDTFSLRATDSHPAPLISVAIDVNGQISNINGVAALTVQPSAVIGGSASMGTVRLNYPARSGGAVVVLSSSGGTASVPASVTIPGGGSTAQFMITTTSPASSSVVTLTAAYGTNAQSAALTVLPAAATLTSIALTPTSVEGGTSVNAVATLGAPAPAGGAFVSLSVSNAALASVPTSVVVPEGATTAAFTVTTRQVGAGSTVTITGVYGATQSATLALSACSALSTAAAPASAPLTTVWVDDAIPAGATATGSGSFVTAQAASGTQSLQIPAGTGTRQWSFSGATTTLTTAGSDILVAYVLVNPCNPPREILFAWSDGATEYRASWGEDLIESTAAHTRVSSMPAGGQWARLEVRAAAIGASGKVLKGLTIKMFDGEAWFDRLGASACSLPANAAAPALPAGDFVWLDDDVPAGASAQGTWVWDTTQKVGGSASHRETTPGGFHQHFYLSDPSPVPVSSGDVLFTYVLIDPCNPPREVMLQWNDGTGWEHRAVWGEHLLGPPDVGGTPGTTSYYHVGPLPPAGTWARLEVPAVFVGLDDQKVFGTAFTLYDGQAWFDRSGKIARVNLALGRTATQSSTLNNIFNPIAGRAVDGNTSGNFTDSTVTHTNADAQAWWQVDLGSVQPIENIELWNRTDCCAERLTDFWVLVSDVAFTSNDLTTARQQSGVSAYHYQAQSARTTGFLIDRTGRFVRVQLSGTNNLSLAEAQVWAPATASRVNVAGGRQATQSASYDTLSGAEQAVNGNAGTRARDFTISIAVGSGSPSQSWWQADLGSVQPISTIDVWSRLDCCPDQTANVYLLISDAAFTSNDVNTLITQPGVTVYYLSPASVGYALSINRTARYVRVAAPNANQLAITEVQVWSQQPTLGPLNIPPLKRSE